MTSGNLPECGLTSSDKFSADRLESPDNIEIVATGDSEAAVFKELGI